jgi:membrane associated rhomboid family serine protease
MVVPFRLVFLMWLVYTVQYRFLMDLSWLGIYPRTWQGLLGVFAAPLIHGNVVHLISNTIPLMFLGWTLFFFYERIGSRVFVICYFGTNVLVWLFGRSFIHIGASGLLYALAAFLAFFGIFRRDLKSIVISLAIIFFYGGLIYGVLPMQEGVSWESHLFGAVVGAICAWQYALHYKGRMV